MTPVKVGFRKTEKEGVRRRGLEGVGRFRGGVEK